jgi:tRNA(Arg) A34 adenosine deaminase TadA
MWSRIDTVYYGSDEMDAKKAGFDDLKFYEMLEEKHKGLSLKQINQEQSTHLFELWSKKEDKILY